MTTTPPTKVYLLLHGYQGQASDLEAYQRILSQHQCHTILSSFNEDSIQKWAQKALQHVKSYFEQTFEKLSSFDQHTNSDNSNTLSASASSEVPPLRFEFSILGHSLGGIIARFMLPDLIQYFESRNYSMHYKNFITIASPHLGVTRPPSKMPHKGLWKWLIETFAWSELGGRIPKQLILQEEQLQEEHIANPNIPLILLHQMCYGKYVEALERFDELLLVAAAHHDFAVPFPSASIRAYNPYQIQELNEYKFEIVGSSGYYSEELTQWCSREVPLDETLSEMEAKHVEQMMTSAASDTPWIWDNYGHLYIHRDMLEKLQRLPWKRLDVRFHTGIVTRYIMPHHNMLVAKALLPLNVIQTRERVALMQECTETLCNVILKKIREDAQQERRE